MSTLERAIEIAIGAHKGQLDKSNSPYIRHVMRVMEKMTTDEEKIVAVLHDVVEDSSWTFQQLIEEGFSGRIITALKCITKQSDEEDYEKFIERVATNSLATSVKIADLTDNMDIRRYKQLTTTEFSRITKYLKAYHKLIEVQNKNRS